MPSSPQPVRVVIPTSIRPGTGVAAGVVVVLVSVLGVGCRTPWSIEPLPVERLEKGMSGEAVRAALGRPARVETAFESPTPKTWEGLPEDSDVHPSEAWRYDDEKVDRAALGVAGLVFPITVPVYLLDLALGTEPAERDCLWLDEREIALFFEDERLAEWVVTTKPERARCVNQGGSGQGMGWTPTGTTTWGVGVGSGPGPSRGPISPPGHPGGN